jgi:hypothetical protein
VKPLARLLIVVLLGTAAAVSSGVASAAATPTCADPAAPLTVEEQRLAQPKTGEVLQRTGFDRFAKIFTPALCVLPDDRVAERAMREQGRVLWEAAVARAQGRLPAGSLPVTDDRPLYWARLQLTKALRQWTPSFELTADRRAELIDALDMASRGQDSIGHKGGGKRLVVTGFDPFVLDQDIRRSNPSGSTALALDGTVIQTAAGPARIETAMFPVLWGPFAQGVVERTLLPQLKRIDMFTTLSQGRVGRFDLERYNGRWRGGFPDNDNVSDLRRPANRAAPTRVRPDDAAVCTDHRREHRPLPSVRQHHRGRNPRGRHRPGDPAGRPDTGLGRPGGWRRRLPVERDRLPRHAPA